MAVDDKFRAWREGNWNCQLTSIPFFPASADQIAEKAESSRSRDMSILVKSNAMRKACKEKTAEMTELDKQLADKLLQTV